LTYTTPTTFEYTQDITFVAPDGQTVTITAAEMTTLNIDSTQEVREEANLRFAAQGVDLFISQGDGTEFILETTSFGDHSVWAAGTSQGGVAGPVIQNLDAAGTAQNTTLANPTGASRVDGQAGGPMGDDLQDFADANKGMGEDLVRTLQQLDTAITGVATQRATFGASMNRLTSVVDNLASASEATSTARGRIEDANYASETTALARSQIISQAATAMLAQANQRAQSVLSLLQ
jgi:flagellin-like hook-associated protein FlgL